MKLTTRFFIIFVVFGVMPGIHAFAAGQRDITLQEVIALARTRSVDAAVAANELRAAYWEYRTFRADLLPEVTFTATIPSFNKRYNSYQREDGSYTFLRDDNIMMNGALTIDQRIWLTGGTLSLTTSLDFVRQLGDGAANRFMSVPVALRLNQPLFAVNDVKWNRRIEPVRYKEARANFVSQTEEVAMLAINYFFNLLSAREEYASAAQNVDNAEKLYEAAKVKREMGRISENDLLQIELNLLNSRSSLTSGESSVRSCMFQLRSFLNLPEDEELVPVVPEQVPLADVNFQDALGHALDNNSLALNIQRRQLEADYEVAKARGERQDFNQNLFILVERFNNQRRQLELALRADEIATRRYDSSVETFLIGKLSALDLNDSQENKDTARSKYLSEMFYYWYYYYQLRSLTLWDFPTDSPVEADFEAIVK